MTDVATQRFVARRASGARPRPIRTFNGVPVLTTFLALVCLIPARWVLPGLGSAGRPASLFGVGLFFLWCGLQGLPWIETKATKFRWFLLFNALVLVLSYALAYDRGLSIKEGLAADRALITLLSISGVMLIASECVPSTADMAKLTKRMTYFAAFIGIMGILTFFTGIDPARSLKFPGLTLNSEIAVLFNRRGTDFVRVKGTTLHPIEFGIVMALALPLSIHHALHEPNKIIRNRRYALVAIIAFASMLTIARSAVVGLAVGSLVLFWGWSSQIRLKAMAAGLVFLVALQAIVPGLLSTLRALFLSWRTDPAITARTDDYAIAAQYIRDRPWLGRGNGTFIPAEYILLDNAYLDRQISTGFIGLGSLLLVLFGGFFMARHAARRHSSALTRHGAVAIAATIAIGIVSGATFDLYFFPTATGYLYLALGLGAYLGHDKSPTPAGELVPQGLLRPGYQPGYRRKPWWHRFDPELRDQPARVDR